MNFGIHSFVYIYNENKIYKIIAGNHWNWRKRKEITIWKHAALFRCANKVRKNKNTQNKIELKSRNEEYRNDRTKLRK